MNVEQWSTFGGQTHRHWSENTKLLLLVSGLLLGLSFPMAKLAGEAQLAATSWVILNSLGASLALLPLLLFTGQLRWPKGRQWRYVFIAGPITFAGPNLLIFLVVPNVGAGYGGIMFALSPVCTILLARLVGMGSLGRVKYIGIGLSLAGAVGISLSRGRIDTSAGYFWPVIAALLPVLLALGNIYRSLDWPKNASPELLAFWSHTIAVLIYGLASVWPGSMWTGSQNFWHSVASAPQLVITQLVLAGLIAPVVFRLQRFGGPVMLSQLGYISAATSLLVATIFLGEDYAILSWFCALLIALGIAISLWSKE